MAPSGGHVAELMRRPLRSTDYSGRTLVVSLITRPLLVKPPVAVAWPRRYLCELS